MYKLDLEKAEEPEIKLPTFIGSWSSMTGFPGGLDGKEFPCNVGDLGSILELERYPGEGNSYLLQYSCLENSMTEKLG